MKLRGFFRIFSYPYPRGSSVGREAGKSICGEPKDFDLDTAGDAVCGMGTTEAMAHAGK
ncbi:MAG: hypothetical protein MR607_01470 [Lachnospiraceae bacterium]|nr:hypothetical protein [Lachnospiraceae bacterium]